MGQIRNTANQNNVYRAVRHGLENLASKLVFLGDDRFESSVIFDWIRTKASADPVFSG
jgi:hypothetical protein